MSAELCDAAQWRADESKAQPTGGKARPLLPSPPEERGAEASSCRAGRIGEEEIRMDYQTHGAAPNWSVAMFMACCGIGTGRGGPTMTVEKNDYTDFFPPVDEEEEPDIIESSRTREDQTTPPCPPPQAEEKVAVKDCNKTVVQQGEVADANDTAAMGRGILDGSVTNNAVAIGTRPRESFVHGCTPGKPQTEAKNDGEVSEKGDESCLPLLDLNSFPSATADPSLTGQDDMGEGDRKSELPIIPDRAEDEDVAGSEVKVLATGPPNLSAAMDNAIVPYDSTKCPPSYITAHAVVDDRTSNVSWWTDVTSPKLESSVRASMKHVKIKGALSPLHDPCAKEDDSVSDMVSCSTSSLVDIDSQGRDAEDESSISSAGEDGASVNGMANCSTSSLVDIDSQGRDAEDESSVPSTALSVPVVEDKDQKDIRKTDMEVLWVTGSQGAPLGKNEKQNVQSEMLVSSMALRVTS